MIVHLAFATLVLAIVLAATHALPLRARTRCTLLLLGIAQFFVPTIPPRLLGIAPERGAAIIRVIGAPLAASAQAAPQHVNWLGLIWAVVATLLVIRTAVAYRSAALLVARATPFSQRDGVAVLRSSEIDTPALAGLFRPVLLLPDYVDDLTAQEVDALLTHECAHLARHDNVIVAVETLASALLWFHPLVWLARRAIAIAREEACDEIVVTRAGTGTYIEALAKVCRASIAPRAATLSCMASNRLTERIGYMNKLGNLKAISHRIAVVSTVLLVAVSAAAAGATAEAKTGQRYALTASMTKVNDTQIRFAIRVMSRETGEVIADSTMNTLIGVPAEARAGSQTRDGHHRDFVITAITPDGTNAKLTLRAEEDGQVVQTSHVEMRMNDHGASENISVTLKDAEIHDVAKVFAQLTGKKVDVAPGITGLVSLDVHNMPWKDVLEQLVAQVGATATIDGDTIRITK